MASPWFKYNNENTMKTKRADVKACQKKYGAKGK